VSVTEPTIYVQTLPSDLEYIISLFEKGGIGKVVFYSNVLQDSVRMPEIKRTNSCRIA
jgi:hypothetical protein